jgi:hypothetical protein
MLGMPRRCNAGAGMRLPRAVAHSGGRSLDAGLAIAAPVGKAPPLDALRRRPAHVDRSAGYLEQPDEPPGRIELTR